MKRKIVCSIIPPLVLVSLAIASAGAQTPGDSSLNQAYKALEKKDYDTSIKLFREGLAEQPANANAHKDLAYTLLKAGENGDARDEFETALKLNPKDETAALEFAFLAYETQKANEARRMFDRLRKSGSPATRATAERAFQSIDKPLADGIARWKQALTRSDKPDDLTMFSAHWELAQLADLRDELQLASEQYEICRRLKPQLGELLLLLAKVWQRMEHLHEAQAALLAASRSSESRTAEQALELLGTRYPYPYEFESAIKIDPHNFALRRELGYLYIAMHKEQQAIEQFEKILELNPKDWSAREQLNALHGVRPQVPAEATPEPSAQAITGAGNATGSKSMGKKSLALGYTHDAVKFLRQAHEEDPDDAEVMLDLGWAYNLAQQDDEAKIWFGLARNADNPKIAAQARKAFHTLNGDVMPQTTVWMLPMFSSRWGDLFSYGQAKRTIPLPFLKSFNKLVSFYVSTRFIGDVKSSLIEAHASDPQYLSESSFIIGAGVATKTWHHVTGWAEAGEAIRYMNRIDIGAAIPDYRGGVNFAKGFGSLLGSSRPGLFYETTGDAIYVSRFGKDWLFYSQHRAGRTFKVGEAASVQLLFNANYVRDTKNQYWANTLEMGPGIRFHPGWMPRNVYFAGDFLRGTFLNDNQIPPRAGYNDLRLSFWYAVTK